MKKNKKVKFKVRKAVRRRIKITGTGKLMRGRSFGRHLKAKKTKKHTRHLKKNITITGSLRRKLQKAMGLR